MNSKLIEKEARHDKDTLHLVLATTEIKNKTDGMDENLSSIYFICGLVKIQIKSTHIYDSKQKHQSVSLRFAKSFASDYLNYAVLVEIVRSNNIILHLLDLDNKETYTEKITIEPINTNINCALWQMLVNNMNGISDLLIKFKFSVEALGPAPFSSLYDDTELLDFELQGTDGSVKVHKLILAGISPVMKTMLAGQWKESYRGAVEIPNTTKEILQQLKDYVYLHKIPSTAELDLAEVAFCYMMKDLQEICVALLLTTVTVDNIFSLLEFAIKHKQGKMVGAIIAIGKHMSGIMERMNSLQIEYEQATDKKQTNK